MHGRLNILYSLELMFLRVYWSRRVKLGILVVFLNYFNFSFNLINEGFQLLGLKERSGSGFIRHVNLEGGR